MSFFTAMQLLGGVGLFLYAIKLISDSLQLIAGERMRNIIGMFTKTPLLGVILGAGVTMVIQSSSATTVMTVSFVEAGLMTLTQAIGVIMGANIGTTITGQILAFKIKDFAYLFVMLGILGLSLPLFGVNIAVMVIRYMALYDVYTSCDPQYNVLFLVLSIIFQVTEPFFLFFNRNKDLGMPPRRQEHYEAPPQEPQWQPPQPMQEPWENKDYL